MEEIYLDYAASTPVDPRVDKAMKPYFGSIYGNPSALHSFGQKTSRALFESRRTIAAAIGANYEEIIFTGSATEANNLAIRGLWDGVKPDKKFKKPRIITFAIEHESVLRACEALEIEGVEVIYIKPDREGFFDLKKFENLLNRETFLVSVMHSNNEVGTIQPLEEISRIITRHHGKHKTNFPYFHTDAVQSLQYLDCDVKKLGVDLMTISAHKIYGPKGIGALYIKKDLQKIIHPMIVGAGQEGGLRSGTENIASIVGFAKAVELVSADQEKERRRIVGLRDRLWVGLKKFSKVQLNGSEQDRLPNNLNLYFPGNDAHELLIKLDLNGVAVSPGAACSTRVAKSSYVLEAMGFPMKRASGSLRFTLGRQTTKQEIDRAISVILKLV